MIFQMMCVLMVAWVVFAIYFSWNTGRSLEFKNKKWEYFAAFLLGFGVALSLIWHAFAKFVERLADTAADIQKRFEARDKARGKAKQDAGQ